MENTNKYRLVKCFVECGDYSDEFSFNVKNDEDLEQAIRYEISDGLIDHFEDIIDSSLSKYNRIVYDSLNIEEISNNLYGGAERYIKSTTSDIPVHVNVLTGSDTPAFSFTIPLSDELIYYIWEKQHSEYGAVAVGSIVYNSLMALEEKGTWFSGLVSEKEILLNPDFWPAPAIKNDLITWEKNNIKYEPLLWFSVSGKINRTWTISNNIDEQSFHFWFETDDFDFGLKHILGDDCCRDFDFFHYWYSYECGYVIPEIDKIRKKCPVSFPASNTVKSANLAVNNYFLSKYKEIH